MEISSLVQLIVLEASLEAVIFDSHIYDLTFLNVSSHEVMGEGF